MYLTLSRQRPELVDDLPAFRRHLFLLHRGPLALQSVVDVAHAQVPDGLGVRILHLAGNAEDVHQRIGFLLFVGLGLLRLSLIHTSPSPRDGLLSRMPSSA